MADSASAWGIGADALASPIPIVGLLKGIFGRRGAKAQRSFARRQAQAGVDQAERGQAEFEQNAPIQQQGMQQSLASRGVGTSSIATEDTKNLMATQARQRAAHVENVDLARRGRSMVLRGQKFARRMGPLNFYEALITKVGQAAGQAAGAPSMGSMMGSGGGGGGGGAAWDSGLVSVGGP